MPNRGKKLVGVPIAGHDGGTLKCHLEHGIKSMSVFKGLFPCNRQIFIFKVLALYAYLLDSGLCGKLNFQIQSPGSIKDAYQGVIGIVYLTAMMTKKKVCRKPDRQPAPF